MSRDDRAGRGHESERRSVLRAQGNSRREHKRRSEENFFPVARGCAEKLPAGYGSPTGDKEKGRSRHGSKRPTMRNRELVRVVIRVCALQVVDSKHKTDG